MSRSVLVIEDEPHIVEAISFILSRDGWSVRSHGQGHDAVAVVRDHPTDVVILDVMLPGRSGYEILQELRADPSTRDLPILMLTARGQAKDRDMAARLGATRVMTKPFSNTELLASVRAMVGP